MNLNSWALVGILAAVAIPFSIGLFVAFNTNPQSINTTHPNDILGQNGANACTTVNGQLSCPNGISLNAPSGSNLAQDIFGVITAGISTAVALVTDIGYTLSLTNQLPFPLNAMLYAGIMFLLGMWLYTWRTKTYNQEVRG